MTKKNKTLLAFTALIFVTLFSCSKKDEATNNLVLGKWYRQSKISWYTSYNNPIYNRKDTTISSGVEYADFRNDNKVYSYYNDGSGFTSDTFNYVVSNDKIIVSNNQHPMPDTVVIQTLTSNKMTWYKKYIGVDNIEEIWNNFSK